MKINKNNISKTIKSYNRIRSPEATASLVKVKNNKLLINFNGPFCETCGVDDYFEDFVIEAEDNNLKLKIKDIQQKEDENYLVEFTLI